MSANDPGPRRMVQRIVFVTLVAAHLLAVVGLIGADNLEGDRPVIDWDLALHYHRALVMRDASGFPGLVWDPAYMGGYTAGGTTCVDNRLGQIGLALLPGLPPGQAWNWTLAFLFALVPLLAYRGARWAGCDPWTSTIATFLALVVFWSLRGYGDPFIEWGLYGWAVASAAIPLMFCGLHRCLERPSLWAALSYGIAVAFLGLAHALSALFVPFLVLVFLGRLPRLRPGGILALAGATATALLLLLPFALPVLRTLPELADSGSGLALYYQSSPEVLRAFISSPERIPANAILVLALIGLVTRSLSRSGSELALVSFAVTALALVSFAIPVLAPVQPTRFLAPALFLATVPAAGMLRRAAAALASVGKRERGVLIALGLIIFAPYLYLWAATAAGRRSFVTEPSPEAAGLVQYLRDTTTTDARVMVEDEGTPFGGRFGTPHLVGCLADEIDRQILGGPHLVNPCRVGWANFVNGTLLDREIGDYGDDELRQLFLAYNVDTIVVWTDASRDRLTQLGLETTALPGGFTVFRTGMARGFAAGAESVTAEASLNVIRVRGATSSPTLLRWHFDSRFRTEPPLPLTAAPSPFSKVGFILVENGAVSEFEVRFEN